VSSTQIVFAYAGDLWVVGREGGDAKRLTTGVGIANRYSQGIYNRRSKNAPKPSMTDRKTLANRKRPKQQIRPRGEWIEIEHPLLRDYLGDLRDRAFAWQKEQLNKQDRSRIKTPSSKDRHVDSTYFLKGILKSTDQGSTWTVLGAESFAPPYPEPPDTYPQDQAVG